MTDEPFGRQPEPVSVIFEGNQIDVDYWYIRFQKLAESAGDITMSLHNRSGFRIYPRAVND